MLYEISSFVQLSRATGYMGWVAVFSRIDPYTSGNARCSYMAYDTDAMSAPSASSADWNLPQIYVGSAESTHVKGYTATVTGSPWTEITSGDSFVAGPIWLGMHPIGLLNAVTRRGLYTCTSEYQMINSEVGESNFAIGMRYRVSAAVDESKMNLSATVHVSDYIWAGEVYLPYLPVVQISQTGVGASASWDYSYFDLQRNDTWVHANDSIPYGSTRSGRVEGAPFL